VLAAYYCPEPLSDRAQRALQQEEERAISWLVEVELASALARKVRAREMRPADGHRILTVFQSHVEQGIYTRLGVEAAHFAKAREWLATFSVSLRTLDVLHMAIAALQGRSLVTADVTLAKTCARLGLEARLISS
jgi:predicted nucleic acid-binding protein